MISDISYCWWLKPTITVSASVTVTSDTSYDPPEPIRVLPGMEEFVEMARRLYREAHPVFEHDSAANTDDAPEFRSGYLQCDDELTCHAQEE